MDVTPQNPASGEAAASPGSEKLPSQEATAPTELENPTFEPPPSLENIGSGESLTLPGIDDPSGPVTPPSGETPGSPGTAADLGQVASANVDSLPKGDLSGKIDEFNQNKPKLGQPVDHSKDNDINVSITPPTKESFGQPGIEVGDEKFRIGYNKNPLNPNQPGVVTFRIKTD
jgi:hypothetical protein